MQVVINIRVKKVSSLITKQFPNSTLINKDIYNTRLKLRRKELNSYTPTSALIITFNTKGILYKVKYADKDKTDLINLVFIIKKLIKITVRY